MRERPLILICDDDPEVLKSLQLSFRTNFDVDTASTVAQAKALTSRNEYDAAIIDLCFEGQELDGIHLLDHLSRSTPGTYLIVLSGDSSTRRVAYVSSALPLFYASGSPNSLEAVQVISRILVIVGFALATVALLELGRSFGVAPANRGVVRSGVYSFLRHPIYLGYGIAELGMVILNPINVSIFSVSVVAYILRAKMEN